MPPIQHNIEREASNKSGNPNRQEDVTGEAAEDDAAAEVRARLIATNYYESFFIL